MQRVCSPRKLPGPEVGLAALLVKICKDEEQQNGNEPGDDGRCDDNTIHRVGGSRWPESPAHFRGKKGASMVSYCGGRTQQKLSTVPDVDFLGPQGVAAEGFAVELA